MILDISKIEFPSGVQKIPFYEDKDTFEIAVSLFERCNLHCTFCFEDHQNSRIDNDYILSIPQIVYDKFCIESRKYSHIKQINLKIWGGELFYDKHDDSMFQLYQQFYDTILQKFRQYDESISVACSWLSNGVFTRRERVDTLLHNSNGKISFSYDPSGRFQFDWQKQQMIDNFEYYKAKNLLNCISITLTHQTVKEYISGTSGIERFRNCFFDVNFYTANPGWEDLILTDDDIYEFLKWAIDSNFTEIGIVRDCISTAHGQKVRHYCDCKTNMQFSKGICTMDCAIRASVLDKSEFYGEYAKDVDEENCNDVKVSLGLKKKGCIFCEYYQTCQKPCWITVIFHGYRSEDCPYRRIYKYIKDNGISNTIQ